MREQHPLSPFVLVFLEVLVALGGLLERQAVVGPADPEAELMTDVPVVTLLGDSISAGFGLPASSALPVRLEAALASLGLSVRVVGAGVSGGQTTGRVMNLETIKANVKSFTIAEWVMVAIVVVACSVVLDTTGLLMGFPIAYILVLAMRRHSAQTASARPSDPPAD